MGKEVMLLSTLAALVIIVHTAEEEYERSQRDTRARSLDVGPPVHGQTWRATAVESISPKVPEGDAWSNNAEELPKRRRNMRKRKRRPQIDQTDDLITQERRVFDNIQSRNSELLVNPPDMTKRRRKHNRKNAWVKSEGWEDEVEIDRPVRKRGHRRKRPPTIETWPRLSEFDNLRPSEKLPEDNLWNNKDTEPIDNGEGINIYEQKNKEDNQEKYDETPETSEIEEISETILPENEVPKNEESLSEFSLESLIKSTDDGLTISEAKSKDPQSERNKALIKIAQNRLTLINSRKNQARRIAKSMDKIIPLCKKVSLEEYRKNKTLYIEDELKMNNEPLAPLTLKAILKRSNGKSLSEILQQNNLSLSDLLQGRVSALSLLKSQDLTKDDENLNLVNEPTTALSKKINDVSKFSHSDSKQVTEYKETKESEATTTTTATVYVTETLSKSPVEESSISNDTFEDVITTTPIAYLRRRFPFNLRRKQHTKPVNQTYKGQLSRDLITLTTRKYQNNRNMHRSRGEWVEYMPSNTKSRNIKTEMENNQDDDEDHITESSIITTISIEETTQSSQTLVDNSITSPNSLEINLSNSFTEEKAETLESDVFSTTSNEDDVPTTISVTEKVVTITQKPKIISQIRSILNASELRRQALNNRLQKKRLREKNLSSQEILQKDFIDTNNMQTSSEFIAKTQPSTINTDSDSDFTTLEDFMPTESVIKHNNRARSTKPPKVRTSVLPKTQPYLIATEESAKFEIEEILNDTMTRARLSRILRERNMTLSELVEHRERGSSHVHLADIFHNASKEPNPPEPFLSKSLIEPISKETYPLIALLEANLHDPKSNLQETDLNSNTLNIPIIMDFGNNVNENGENMGIMSMFNNNVSLRDTDGHVKTNIVNDVDVTPKIDRKVEQKSVRESRILSSESGLVDWKELFKLLKNQTDQKELLEPRMSSKSENLQKILLQDDDEAAGIIVFEDLEQLKGNNKVDTLKEDNVDFNFLNKIEETRARPVYNPISNTRSITVVVASIIGLALVLFLLTYAAFKWKQQSKMIEDKQCNNDDRLPSPIFENRKCNIRSSTRSKSPMLTSNIYSINTLDTHAGTESPEYTWDSLRKPFQ